jgi:hypothetical protein
MAAEQAEYERKLHAVLEHRERCMMRRAAQANRVHALEDAASQTAAAALLRTGLHMSGVVAAVHVVKGCTGELSTI